MGFDTRCGLSCADCTYREQTGCGGCVATMGNPFHGACGLAACCQGKGHAHCGACEAFPCELLIAFTNDPEHGDNGARVENLRNWVQDNAAAGKLR